MCESTAYLEKDGKEELLLAEVGYFKPEGGGYLLRSILGDEKLVEADLKEINLLEHKIVLSAK